MASVAETESWGTTAMAVASPSLFLVILKIMQGAREKTIFLGHGRDEEFKPAPGGMGGVKVVSGPDLV